MGHAGSKGPLTGAVSLSGAPGIETAGARALANGRHGGGDDAQGGTEVMVAPHLGHRRPPAGRLAAGLAWLAVQQPARLA